MQTSCSQVASNIFECLKGCWKVLNQAHFPKSDQMTKHKNFFFLFGLKFSPLLHIYFVVINSLIILMGLLKSCQVMVQINDSFCNFEMSHFKKFCFYHNIPSCTFYRLQVYNMFRKSTAPQTLIVQNKW